MFQGKVPHLRRSPALAHRPEHTFPVHVAFLCPLSRSMRRTSDPRIMEPTLRSTGVRRLDVAPAEHPSRDEIEAVHPRRGQTTNNEQKAPF